MNEFKHGDEVWVWDEDEIEDAVTAIYIGESIEEGTEKPHIAQFESGEIYDWMFASFEKPTH